MSLRSQLDNLCSIQTRTTTKNSMGVPDTSFATSSSGIPCLVRPLSAGEQVIGAQYAESTVLKLYVLPTVSITTLDRVAVNSQTYSVVHVYSIPSSHKEVWLSTKLV